MKFWLIKEDCGAFCAVFTYFIVVLVYFGFIRVGIWEEIQYGDVKGLFHFIVFQFNCFMIFLSHFKCMTTQPGVLPMEKETLEFKSLPEYLKIMIKKIGLMTFELQQKIRDDLSERIAQVQDP